MQQVDINYSLDIPPGVAEVKKAINQLSSGKAPRSDVIPADIYKAGGPEAHCQSFWTQGAIP